MSSRLSFSVKLFYGGFQAVLLAHISTRTVTRSLTCKLASLKHLELFHIFLLFHTISHYVEFNVNYFLHRFCVRLNLNIEYIVMTSGGRTISRLFSTFIEID